MHHTLIRGVAAILVYVCGTAACLFAQSGGNTLKYTGILDENYISGPKITEKSLAGKVVLWEYWGKNCGPCIASLPHLQDLWKKYEKTGKFMVIGSHCQTRDDAAIKKILSSNNVTYPVYQFICTSGGRPQGGIPFAVLTDHTGKVVKTGHPSTMYELVPALVKAAPGVNFILGAMEIKYNKSLTSKLQYGKPLEATISALEKKAAGTTPESVEAKEISDKISEWKKSFQDEIAADSVKAVSRSYEKMLAYKAMFPSDKTYNEPVETLKGNRDLALLMQVRKETESEELKYRKKGKPSKAVASKFASLKKKLAGISDEKVRPEADELEAFLDALETETTPK